MGILVEDFFYNGYEVQLYALDLKKWYFVLKDNHSKDVLYKSEYIQSSDIMKYIKDFINQQKLF